MNADNWKIPQDWVDKYLKVCKEASENDEAFHTFRRNPDYTQILEHCPVRIANNYLKFIKERKALSLLHSDNEYYGSPETHDFGNFTEASTSTVQYLGVALNLELQFGSLQGRKIVEIGGGYGGQCKVLQDVWHIESYTIFDLPEVNALQNKYLGKFKKKGIKFETKSEIPKSNKDRYSLVISNYALSELPDPLQDEYVREILLNSKMGYITCNRPINSVDLLKEKFDSFKIISDIEGERESNYIIIW